MRITNMTKVEKNTLLHVRDLSVVIERDEGIVRPLNGVSFSIQPGQAIGIVGESGCGKTMTSNAILRILPPGSKITSGQIQFQAKEDVAPVDLVKIDSEGPEIRSIRGGDISMIFQEPMTAFSPVHTVGNQIIEMIRLHKIMDENEMRLRSIELLRLVGIKDPETRIDSYPFQLSGGMRQRAMIAMALASEPKLLIADEPTTALDVTVQARVLKLIGRIQKDLGLSLILITHDLGVIAHTVEYVYVMHSGKVVEEGPVERIFHSPQHPYTESLLKAMPSNLPRKEVNMEIDDNSNESSLNDHIEPILQVKNLKKFFPIRSGLLQRQVGWVKAVDGVSFSLNKGKILGLVGESGCGKTTTGRMILKALEPSSGQIQFKKNNNELVNIPELNEQQLKEVRKEVQMIFQDPYSSLNPRMPVLDLISEPLKAYGWSKKDREERAVELMERVGLNPRYLRRYPHAFSGGQRQRIGIARALALNPSLIVADEPVSALDVSIQAQVLELLQNLKNDLDLTLLFISHDLSVVRYLCDEVAVMFMGKIVEHAETEVLFSNPQHPYTSTLLNAAPPPDPHAPWLVEDVDE